MSMGIYKITNQINGKVYIGQSVNIEHRWVEHRSIFKLNKSNSILYKAFDKYGFENFSFEIIEECSQDDLDDREIYWIKYYDATNREKGYNIRQGGETGFVYDYQQIYNLWKEGFSCKEIQKKLSCGDQVVTNALRTFGVSEKETKGRVQNKKKYVALSKDGKPLKVFQGMKQISAYFTGFEGKADKLPKKIEYHYSLFGYYWDYLNENNYPKSELTDEEFLSYQNKIEHLTQKRKEEISLQQRIVERPEREELKNLIRTKSFLEIGRMYGVSDNAIRRWCDFEKLPRKKGEIKKYTDEEWELI